MLQWGDGATERWGDGARERRGDGVKGLRDEETKRDEGTVGERMISCYWKIFVVVCEKMGLEADI